MDMIVIIVIAVLFFIMLLFMFSNSMALQRFGFMEAFLIISVSVCFFVGMNQVKDSIRDEYDKAALAQAGTLYSYMSELENTVDAADTVYDEFEEKVAEAMAGADNSYADRMYEAAVLIQKTAGSYELCSMTGEDKAFWGNNMSAITALSDSALMNSRIRSSTVEGGVLYAVVDKGNMNASYVIAIELSDDAFNTRITQIKLTYLKYAGIIAAVATALLVFVTVMQYREIKNMVKLMHRIAQKKDFKLIADERKGVRIHSNEMRILYNGMCQVMSDVLRDNYTTYKALQIYYRFAPKNIERIMGKSSILDVEINEQVNLEATLAYVSFNINERLEQHEQLKDINEYYTWLVEDRKKYGGIILNSSMDISTIQMMFNEENKSAVQFGIELSSQLPSVRGKKGTFILLHRTTFVYGISGDEEQSFAFAHSVEMKAIEKYVDSLRKMGIRMAVTDRVYELLTPDISSRYIGYVDEGGMRFKIYEILDAYPVVERQKRIENIGKFNEALNLMYQSDFYFARTMFTEILKECPEDDVAKHYIFRCESCLNRDNDTEVRFSLF